MGYDWNFGRLLPYAKAFGLGVLTTISLTITVILIGTVCGVLLGLFMSRRWPRRILHPIVDVVRAIPPLVLILFTYYLLTRQVIGITLSAYWVCIVAMSANLAAFTSDLVRAAVANVPAAALDAGRAVGMTQRQLTVHIVLPSILRDILPAMTVLYIGMLKMSSLASVIGVRDVVFSAQVVITRISRSLEAWIVVAAIYIVLVVPSTYGARRLESWARRGREGR